MPQSVNQNKRKTPFPSYIASARHLVILVRDITRGHNLSLLLFSGYLPSEYANCKAYLSTLRLCPPTLSLRVIEHCSGNIFTGSLINNMLSHLPGIP